MAVPGVEIYGNNAATTLAAGINSTATSLTVLSGTGAEFPSPAAGQFFRFTLNDALTGLVFEIIYCTARSGDTFSGLQRGQEGTTAEAWLSADKVFEGPTAGAMANLTQALQVQQNYYNYATDTGSANADAIALPISLSTPVPGAMIYWLAAHANTGASTITVNGSGAYPLLGGARVALQAGEVNKFCVMTYDAALSSYVLLDSSGGTLQVPNAVASQQAVPLGQANATFAALAGNATQAFSASQINSGVMAAPGSTALFLESNNYVAAVNLANTAYAQLYVAAAATGQAAVNLTQADGRYAKLAGLSTQAFSASEILSNNFNAGANICYLASNQYTASVNAAISAYVPHFCLASANGQAAVPLGYAQSLFAALNGSSAQVFNVTNLQMFGNSIISETGGALYLQASGGVNITNNGASINTPLSCAAGTASNQAVVYGQFPLDPNIPGYVKLPNGLTIQWGQTTVGAGTSVGFPLVFPNICFSVVVCEGAASSGSWAATHITVHGASNMSQSGYVGWGEEWNGTGFAYAVLTQNFIAVGY
jgi:hypothetical protein